LSCSTTVDSICSDGVSIGVTSFGPSCVEPKIGQSYHTVPSDKWVTYYKSNINVVKRQDHSCIDLQVHHILLSRHRVSSIAFSHQFFNDDRGRELLHESSPGSSTNASKAHYSQSRSNHCTTIPYPTHSAFHTPARRISMHSNIVPITFTVRFEAQIAELTNLTVNCIASCSRTPIHHGTPSRRAKR
jgi:hypothetical protein